MGTKDGNGSEFADCAIGGAITGWVSWKVDNPYNWILIGRAIQGIGRWCNASCYTVCW